jgi:hypothetical protein
MPMNADNPVPIRIVRSSDRRIYRHSTAFALLAFIGVDRRLSADHRLMPAGAR